MHACTLTPLDFESGGAALDVQAKVGTSTSPTSTGTKSVTGVGFQPKALIDFGINQAGDGTGSNAILSFGAATSPTSRGGISVSSKNGQATSDTSRRHDDTVVYTALNDGGNEQESADLDSFDSDGFTRDWESALAFERILNHICLGGTSLEASVTLQQMNGTGADESFAHGLTGGAPTALLFFGVAEASAPPSTPAHCGFQLGAWAGSNQFASFAASRNGQSTTNTFRILTNDSVLWASNFGGGAATEIMSVDSVDATNVNVSYDAFTSEDRFFMLALRGCTAQVGTFDASDTADPVTISCSGITPKLFLPVSMSLGVDSLGSVQSDAVLTIGASDGTNTVSCGITDEDDESVATNTGRYQDSDGFEEYNLAGALRGKADISFDGESVIYDPSSSLPSWNQGAYLIIGN